MGLGWGTLKKNINLKLEDRVLKFHLLKYSLLGYTLNHTAGVF